MPSLENRFKKKQKNAAVVQQACNELWISQTSMLVMRYICNLSCKAARFIFSDH